MDVYLLRHGDAISGFRDGSRPLSPIGRGEVERSIERLITRTETADAPRPVEIQHSGILRASQTAEIARELLGLSPDVVRSTPGLRPEDDPRHQAIVLRHDPRTLLLCSHMPFLARLTAELAGPDCPPAAGFGTAWMVHLHREEEGGAFELRGFHGPD